MRCSIVHSGQDALVAIRRSPPDLLVLDRMLPDVDGMDVCRKLKADVATRDIPIIMVTAKAEDADIVSGIEIGADDYLSKPFNPRELLARIKAVLRRQGPAPAEEHALTAAGIRLEPARREVTVDGTAVELTTTEFDILRALLAAAGRVIPRERLMEQARGQEWAAYDRSVDVHISHLRRKLGDDPRKPSKIKTIRGVGYLVPRDS